MLRAVGGAFDVAFVESSYVRAGRVYCDCGRPGLGARRWTNVPVLGMGGGEGRGLTVPPTPASTEQEKSIYGTGSQVLIGYYDGHRPIILGTLGNVKLGLSTTAQSESSNDSDADPKHDVESVSLRNADASIVLDGHGHIRVVPLAGKPVRVELGAGAIMRVSKGNNADAAVASGPVTRSEFNRVIDRLNVVSSALAELLAATQSITYVEPEKLTNVLSHLITFEHIEEESASTDIESQTLFIPLEGSGSPDGQSQ